MEKIAPNIPKKAVIHPNPKEVLFMPSTYPSSKALSLAYR
jgi:hypothetical protein